MKRLLAGFVFVACIFSTNFFVTNDVFAKDDTSTTVSVEPTTGIIPAPRGAGSLGEKIKTGKVTLSDVPLIIVYLIDLVTKLAGTIAVIFILYAGFQLIFSGASDDKQSAKDTLKWAVIGLVVTFTAWIIVNIIQTQLTS